MQKEVDYATAVRSKYPEQVVIAIAKDVKGTPNPITLGWTMITSGSPPMMAISIGETRYSLEALRHSGEFVVAFPSEDAAEEAMFYGTKSGRDVDKLKEFDAKTQPASKIDGVLLSDAVGNFECTVRHEIHTGDHFLFVGEVVAAHVNEETKGRLYTLASGHRMGGVSVKA